MASKIYKIKKAVAYIKHYGPDKLAKKAIGKLIGKDGYSEHFSELVRSEERRVGKECRSRWSPYH